MHVHLYRHLHKHAAAHEGTALACFCFPKLKVELWFLRHFTFLVPYRYCTCLECMQCEETLLAHFELCSQPKNITKGDNSKSKAEIWLILSVLYDRALDNWGYLMIIEG